MAKILSQRGVIRHEKFEQRLAELEPEYPRIRELIAGGLAKLQSVGA